jgi:hypothetical protein
MKTSNLSSTSAGEHEAAGETAPATLDEQSRTYLQQVRTAIDWLHPILERDGIPSVRCYGRRRRLSWSHER